MSGREPEIQQAQAEYQPGDTFHAPSFKPDTHSAVTMNPINRASPCIAISRAQWRRFRPPISLPSYDRDIFTIAHHEAAHAVVFALLGLPVASAVVLPEGSPNSSCVILDRKEIARCNRLPSAGNSTSTIRKQAALLFAAGFYAGMQAELVLHGHPLDGYLTVSCTDHDAAGGILAKHCDGETSSKYEAQHLARAILQHHWPAVQTLAKQLSDFVGERLGPADVVAVLPTVLPCHDDLLALLPPVNTDNRRSLLLW
ncbi:MAG: hypothetical protein D4S02_15415 [Rhodocyclaceae bacterium]|nr:MAG: hypothetical protein D4S02_15415 [Rhodocyclaceae bacterium]